ncbi:DeoR/GlpR family transcriptional regulator of sugar metabolism [Actinopolyspora biskrensis]|uniref:Lactose phosphotransferase system repressor n=1 Tax=Actinopolyspora biskrensis TaxID=1470178 RepID=A0A852YQB8_9ACTN|nr:DeoR/GlpR family DNA-binding transcription regulator [Actinopolyspora biskrensis]NYH76931.1 DeoR/GlpR family transcriptional regulator of sugar metabolism [Actinopolyspora biskrensis]
MVAARPSEAAVEQRRQEVLRFVVDSGRARIDELAARFGVSLMTMHRDLDDLAARHLLRKFRGRVESFPSLTMETATRFRVGLHVAEKEAMAAASVGEVRSDSTVILDDSSTLLPFARRLTGIERLTAATNSFGVARALSGGRREVLMIGGRFREEFDSCTGPDVLRGLSRLRADLAVTSATAVAQGRLFHPIQEFAEIKEAMCAAAERRVLLVDHSKFGKTATYAHGGVDAYDLVVTDEATPAEEIAAIREHGTEVRVTPVPAAEDFPGDVPQSQRSD